jgi:phosphopantothenoylcysteine decarboxylase/phosphopantothenate--cysteine ligase
MSAPLDLAGKHIVLGLTGGIACYKAADFTRELVKAGATVQIVMTAAAEAFITPVTMQALSNRSVYSSQWDAREPNNMAHINLTRDADAIVVAPASADFIAKLAQGRADDLLSLACLARPIQRCPLLVAPAMNREMWAHPATRRNLAQLRLDGATLLGPGHGDQACGETGDGRMLEPAELLADLVAYFQPKRLAGLRVLITAGPTFEPIDPVRGITNLSSGKMGFAIARRPRPAPSSRSSLVRCTNLRRASCRASTSAPRSKCSMRCSTLRRRTMCSSPRPRSLIGGPPRLPSAKSRKAPTTLRRRSR